MTDIQQLLEPYHIFFTKNKLASTKNLTAAWLETPLGLIIAASDDTALYTLEFADQRGIALSRLTKKLNATLTLGRTTVLDSIEHELQLYFTGQLRYFTTPVNPLGSAFQQHVWAALSTTPYGKTWSYTQLAQAIGKPTACRAVANANGANPCVIIIPCHRVINHNGQLGGFSCGIERKQWLLEHERRMSAL